MNLRPSHKDVLKLDITPLIDVVFLLLIFFMVSTTFEHDAEINITLPEASEEPVETKSETITITINQRGLIYINNSLLSDAQIKGVKEALSMATATLNAPSIIISADANTPHQSVITVMDAARQLGLTKIAFAVQQDREE